MNDKDREILLKIISRCRNAMDYTAAHNDLESFEKDSMCVEATVFNLMQIGELAKFSLSEELKRDIVRCPSVLSII